MADMPTLANSSKLNRIEHGGEFEFNPMKYNLRRARALFENDGEFKTHVPLMASLLVEIEIVENIRKTKELLND